MRKLALFAVLTTLVPWACAQRMASGASPHFAGPAHNSTLGFNGVRGNFKRGNFTPRAEAGPRSRFPRTGPFGDQLFPLFSDWLSSEDLYAAGYPVASQLPFMVQGGGPAGAADFSERQPQAPHESLLIELQGDRYVRVSDNPAESRVRQLTSDPTLDVQQVAPRRNPARPATHDSTSQQAAVAAAASGTPLPPVTLVLRDGTRQQVRDYTIDDGVLYARGDFYTDGYWNKTIQLSTLNVPETLSANSAQGVKFILPSAPNEVITRP